MEIKQGQIYKNVYDDRYRVAAAYGGAATPLPRVAHLELVSKGLNIKNRVVPDNISLTAEQMERQKWEEVRP